MRSVWTSRSLTEALSCCCYTFFLMRRWFAILLLVLLPAQLTWAAAAGYCMHKPGAAVSHFGHHEHVEHSHACAPSQASGDVPDGEGSDASAGASHDCGHCHGHAAGIPLDIKPLRIDWVRCASAQAGEELWPAHAAVRPERPKWVHLA